MKNQYHKLFDAHSDILMDVLHKKAKGKFNLIPELYFDEFERGNLGTIIFAICLEEKHLPNLALQTALDMVSLLHDEITASNGKMVFCKTYDEIVNAREENKYAVMLGLEGAEPLYDDIHLLPVFYKLGVRFLGLCWTWKNYAATGAPIKRVENQDQSGLTPFGFELVKKADELGMIIDLAHINDGGFADVMSIIKKPVIVSHTACRALNNIPRNISDDQIKMVAKNNGVVGINSVSILVSEKGEHATVERIADHIDHVIQLVGPDHVGMGFDFFENFVEEADIDAVRNLFGGNLFDIIKGHAFVNQLIGVLEKRKYRNEVINKILSDNFMRVCRELI